MGRVERDKADRDVAVRVRGDQCRCLQLGLAAGLGLAGGQQRHTGRIGIAPRRLSRGPAARVAGAASASAAARRRVRRVIAA